MRLNPPTLFFFFFLLFINGRPTDSKTEIIPMKSNRNTSYLLNLLFDVLWEFFVYFGFLSVIYFCSLSFLFAFFVCEFYNLLT